MSVTKDSPLGRNIEPGRNKIVKVATPMKRVTSQIRLLLNKERRTAKRIAGEGHMAAGAITCPSRLHAIVTELLTELLTDAAASLIVSGDYAAES